MDQRSLYKRQAEHCILSGGARDAALLGRDQYVRDFIASRRRVEDAPLKIIELSVGEGRFAALLLDSLANVHLTGVDISIDRLNYVDALLRDIYEITADNFKLVECNLDLEFDRIASSAYRVVVALDILEHVVDVFGFIDNCHRILESGGWLVIRVPNIAYIKHRVDLLAGKLPVTASWFGSRNELTPWRLLHGWDGGHLHLFTIPILCKLLSEYGLNVEICKDPGTRFSKIRNLWPSLLYSNPIIIAKK